MSAKEHSLTVQRHARYFTLGSLSHETKHLWIVLHGYGMLAEFFVKHFEPIVDSTTCVVAPEGLSRFYLDGTWGRVGASWMTKEDRLHEIQDQVEYFRTLLAHLRSLAHHPQLKITLLGFSQGTATAWRLFKKNIVEPDNLVFWAGGIPKEDHPKLPTLLTQQKSWLVYATKDQYMPLPAIKEVLKHFESSIPYFKSISFEDTHKMNTEALLKLRDQIRSAH